MSTRSLPPPGATGEHSCGSKVREAIRAAALLGGWALLTALAYLTIGCGEKSPVEPVPRLVQFDPPAGSIETEPYLWLRFEARRIDELPVQALFTVDGDSMLVGAELLWLADTPGAHKVWAEIDLGEKRFNATWNVDVLDSASISPPAVVDFTVASGARAGSVELRWESPPPSSYQIPPSEYLVYHSSQSMADDQLGSPTEIVYPHDFSSILQVHVLDGLDKGQPWFFRVRMRDALGFVSPLSPMRQARVTGEFHLSGWCWSFVETPLRLLPEEGVALEIDGSMQNSGADGFFAFPPLPDILTNVGLTVVVPQGLDVYPFSIPNLEAVDQVIDLSFLPRDQVHIQSSDPSIEDPMDFLKFVRTMTETQTNGLSPLGRVYHWPSYPVSVAVQPFSYQSNNGEIVDYGLAFTRAIRMWNEVAGLDMLKQVDGPITEGAFYNVDLPATAPILGSTKLVEPVGETFHTAVPEKVEIQLKRFFSQALTDRIVAHELGHVLGLGHSPDERHLMNAVVNERTADRAQPDEARIVRLIRTLPQGTNMSWYGSGN